ncbi:MAG: hypothetical protein R3B81_15005 [bacterium]
MTSRRLPVLASGVVLLLAGIALLAYARSGNESLAPRPLRFALGAGGDLRAGTFRASRSARYELEIEIDWIGTPAEELRAFRRVDLANPIALDWTVTDRATSEVVGAGDSGEFLYVTDWVGRFQRLADRLLARDVPAPYSAAGRGIGAFRAVAGHTYRVAVDLSPIAPAYVTGDPQLSVRLDRGVRRALLRRTDSLASIGGACLLIGVVVFALGLRPRRAR